MSFLDLPHHAAHGHSDFLTYRLLQPLPHHSSSLGHHQHQHNQQRQPVSVCLACLLDSLADEAELPSRKAFVLRYVRREPGQENIGAQRGRRQCPWVLTWIRSCTFAWCRSTPQH